MEKVRRVERMAALTKQLVDHPQELLSLNDFCDLFGIAKSTLSEDLNALRKGIEKYGLGKLETVAGAAGGVRYIPYRSGKMANDVLLTVKEKLEDPARIIPGGFIYMSDILCDATLSMQLGEVLMTRFAHMKPDYILTVETKGIPLALMVAKAFHKPLVIARRDSKVTEGSSIGINYVSGPQGKLQTMSLTKRALAPHSRVLIIDDFMRGGGTIKGMHELISEIGSQVVGVGVLMATEEPQEKMVSDYTALFSCRYGEEKAYLDITPNFDVE